MKKDYPSLNIKVKKIELCSQDQIQENSGKDLKLEIKELLNFLQIWDL